METLLVGYDSEGFPIYDYDKLINCLGIIRYVCYKQKNHDYEFLNFAQLRMNKTYFKVSWSGISYYPLQDNKEGFAVVYPDKLEELRLLVSGLEILEVIRIGEDDI